VRCSGRQQRGKECAGEKPDKPSRGEAAPPAEKPVVEVEPKKPRKRKLKGE
jgi:hypothetical protein